LCDIDSKDFHNHHYITLNYTTLHYITHKFALIPFVYIELKYSNLFSQNWTVYWMCSYWPCVLISAEENDVIQISRNYIKESDSHLEYVPLLMEKLDQPLLHMDVGLAWWPFVASSWIWWNGCTIVNWRLLQLLQCSVRRN
jgi:hypothetical protein